MAVLVFAGDESVDITAALESNGAEITVRSTADTAAEIVAATDPDCIVTAYDPPNIEAPAVLDRIRSGGHDHPFLLYAPEAEDGVVQQILAAGGEYLCEHSDTADRTLLLTRVRALVESHRTKERLELYKRANDQAPVGVTIADADDPDESLVYANVRFEEITGYDASFAVGRNCRFLQGPGTDQAGVDRLREGIDAREPVSEVLLNYDADGTPFWNQLDIAPVRADDGEITHLFGFQKDVTEREELERDLRRQKELQERFAEVVSHDLRNPLGLAQGHIDILQEAYQHESIDEIAYALDRMSELIDDVLEMTRGGAAVVDPTTVDLSSVASAARQTVAEQPVDVEIADDLPTIEGDADRITTLFENLFRNAAEHASAPSDSEPRPDAADRAGSGDERAAVRVGPLTNVAGPDERADRPDGSISFSGFYVEDDGPGIPEDDRESVFDWGVTSSDDGTGFGLAIVGIIAEVHGWAVTVTESPADAADVGGETEGGQTDWSGGGARFEFRIDGVPSS
jgi:PAS domain S-box-containing protein